MFKDVFAELLQKNNVTAYKLSKDIEVSEPTISKWKNGIKYPSYENILKLSNYFHISTDYLFEREKTQTANIDQSVKDSIVEHNNPIVNNETRENKEILLNDTQRAIVTATNGLDDEQQARVLLYIYQLKKETV